jgi:hypothetical protein
MPSPFEILELLAGSDDGAIYALSAAHGFDFDLIAHLVSERLVTATTTHLRRGQADGRRECGPRTRGGGRR